MGLKINVTEPLCDYFGEPIIEKGSKTKVTLRMLLRQVLNSPVENEPWTPDLMLQCADLSRRLTSEETPEFDEKERTMMRERAGKVYAYMPDAPQFYMLISEALADPPAESAPEE